MYDCWRFLLATLLQCVLCHFPQCQAFSSLTVGALYQHTLSLLLGLEALGGAKVHYCHSWFIY